MTEDLDVRKAVAYQIAAAVLWSSGGLLIKMVEVTPLALAGLRSAIAALFLLAVLGRPVFTWSRTQLAAAFMYAGVMIFFVIATKMTSAANAILLQYTAPVYVALFSAWFLREQISARDWVGIICSLIGVLLFFADDLSTSGLIGNLFGLASGICLAWMFMLLRKQKKGSPLESILLGNVLTALVGLPFVIEQAPHTGDWPGLLLLGVAQIAVPYIFFAKSIRHVSAISAILISMIEPVLNPILVLIWLGEIPGGWATAGGGIVILSSLLRALPQLRASLSDR